MIKLITCDIDGTLIPEYIDGISQDIFNLIEDFYKKGVIFIPTSGRQLYNLKSIFYPVRDKIGYIAENGALIEYKNELIFKSKIDYSLLNNIVNKALLRDDLELYLCGEKTTYILLNTSSFSKNEEKNPKENVKKISSLQQIDEDIVKVSTFCENSITDDIIKYFDEHIIDKLQRTISGENWYDFMNINVHKGNAIKFLQNIIDVSPQETVAFGDNFNDIEMLKDAAYSYAMENAHEDVKKVAKYTCKDVSVVLKQLYKEFF